MYTQLSNELKYTRKDFSSVCKLNNIDPEWADPTQLQVLMCDECGYWETPKRATIKKDGTVFCKACNELEDIRF